MAAPTSVAKSAQNASEIGWAFVPQYYTFVNKDPSRLHCFYTKRSTLIHSTEGEEATPCFGQQEIHEKFMSLNFDDCKVFVSNVDSQSSADGGIIVQVLGEMSNGAGPWRKFAQTFFLAEQPNGFFVLNDIFRYMKEETEDAEDEPQAEPITVKNDAAPEAGLKAQASDVPPPSSTLTSIKPVPEPVSTPPVAAPSAAKPAEAVATSEASVPPQAASASQINGFHPESKISDPNAQSTKSSSKPQKVPAVSPPAEVAATCAPATAPLGPSTATSASVITPNQDASKLKPETAGSSRSPSVPSVNGRTVSAQSKSSAAAPASSVTSKPSEAAQPSAFKSWATLAASGKSAWGQGHLSSSQGVSSAPSATSVSAPESQAAQASKPVGTATPNSNNPDRYPPVDSISTGSCFIKSVNENIDEKSLKDQLVKKFGPIKELDIVRTKACGFLEFERIESAKKAIQMSMPFNMGGKGGIQIVTGTGEEYTINIESKRQPGERGRPVDAGPKRGFGGDRGGRGGAGGHFSGPAGSGTGSGRGRGGIDGGSRGTNRGGATGGSGHRGSGRGVAHPK